MKVLVACEFSGTVRDAFIAAGHEAVSCDLVPTTKPGPHIQGDVLDVLDLGWDLVIAHPPCRYLAASGLHWNKDNPEREAKTEEALAFATALLEAPAPLVAVENPVGALGTRVRPPDQWIQPWMFGHRYSKKTGLWLRGLPPLQPTRWLEPPKGGWGNPRHDMGPYADESKRPRTRSVTPRGVAKAMAKQWGKPA